MKKVLAVVLCLGLCNCGYGKIAKKNNELLVTLRTGQPTQEVLQVMGPPEKSEKYSDKEKTMDVWFYRTNSASGGWDAEDSLTPIVFENDKLVGWGKNFYDGKTMFDTMLRRNIYGSGEGQDLGY